MKIIIILFYFFGWVSSPIMAQKTTEQASDTFRSIFYGPYSEIPLFEKACEFEQKKQIAKAKSIFLKLTLDIIPRRGNFAATSNKPSIHLTNIYLSENNWDSALYFLQLADRRYSGVCSQGQYRRARQKQIQLGRIHAGKGENIDALAYLLPFAFIPDYPFEEEYMFEDEFPLVDLSKLIIKCLADSFGEKTLRKWVKKGKFELLFKEQLLEENLINRFDKHCSSCRLKIGDYFILIWEEDYYFDQEIGQVHVKRYYSRVHCEQAIWESLFWKELLKFSLE